MTTPVARFLDLWLDAHDVPAVARFWGQALGMTPAPADHDAVRLEGHHSLDALWVRQAPPHADGCTIHVDIAVDHITPLLAQGARMVDASSYPWVVLEGPEGCEICAFPRDPHSRRRLIDLIMECADPPTAAPWWAELLGAGYHVSADGDYAWVEPVPGAPFDSMVFARQEELPAGDCCRLRPRLATHDLGALYAAGATRVEHAGPGELLLAGPAGNEFFVQVSDLVVRPDDED